MTLTTTESGASSDSYVELADYEAYILNNFNVDISSDATAEKEADLRRATQVIDRKYTFKGYPTEDDQALQFPRVTDVLVDGREVSNTTVPQRVKDAQCEIAYLIKGGLDPFATVEHGAVKRKRVKAGPAEAETEYQGSRQTPRMVAAEGLLKPFIAGGGRGRFKIGRG